MSTRKSLSERLEYERSARGLRGIGSQHYHDYFEVYFLEEGNCHYFIDDKAYEVESGDVVLIPEGIIHKTIYDASGHSRRLLYLSRSYIPSAVASRLDSLLYVYRNPALIPRIREIFDVIESERSSPDALSEEILHHQVGLLFCLLARNVSPSPLQPSGNVYTTETIAYVKQHFREEIHLSDLAKRCSISPEHLSRLFKKETGFGISEYLSMIRLQHAKHLLRSSPDLCVAEIADLCGYNDSNYFSEQFKRNCGVSPRAFRKG